jgi:hypothetical protein
VIVRISANYEKQLAQDMCGRGQDYYFDVIVFSGEGKPLFAARACRVLVDDYEIYHKDVWLVEAIVLTVKEKAVYINTIFSRKLLGG